MNVNGSKWNVDEGVWSSMMVYECIWKRMIVNEPIW